MEPSINIPDHKPDIIQPSSAEKPDRTVLFLALICVGLAGNYFKFPIFLNIDFLFGSIFALLALQFFGLGRGIAASAIIAGYTFILWNHPYAIIIMTAEIAVVGLLTGRCRIGMVLADALYWLFIGMPLVWLFYYLVMNVPLNTVSITMTKQTINGITNALAARLLFTGYMLISKKQHFSYRETIYSLLAFFVLVPALIILAVSSRNDFWETDLHIRTTLARDSQLLGQQLATWVDNRKMAVVYLAGEASDKTPHQMQPFIKQAKQSDPNFLRIGLQDAKATSTAYYPMLDELGQKNIGKNYTDRPYIPVLKKTLKPMLSEVVMGRVGRPKPFVVMLAPVVLHDGYGGYISGILSLHQLQSAFDQTAYQSDMLYTLLDRNDRVIMTNCPDQTIMKPFVRSKGTLIRVDTVINQFIPALPPATPASERWRKSTYIAESAIGSWSEWKLILGQPVAPFQKKLYETYAQKLGLLLLILLVSLTLAELLSRRHIAAIKKLSQVSQDLPRKLTMNNTEIIWPESSLYETNQLIENFRKMALSLSEQFNKIKHFNKSLEQQADELRLAKSIAENAATAKTRFLNTVTHEFRTPLSLLSSSTDILDRYGKQLNTKQITEQNQHIRSATRQLSKLIDSVLLFNRLGSKSQLYAPVVLDVAQFCHTITEEVQITWSTGQHFSSTIDAACGNMLLDRIRFRQTLENLLTNAFRYTPPDGSVSLQVRRRDNHLILQISDTGIGIPEEEWEQIFNPFYRGSNVDARRGLGLGLSIVHEALQQMRGTLQFSSKPGQGTTFRVEISVTDSPACEDG
jgi:signal transduction histidine kinase